jgi:hypothetical protein
MELLAVAGLFVGLALLAAIPLVILLHVTQRHPDGDADRNSGATPPVPGIT